MTVMRFRNVCSGQRASSILHLILVLIPSAFDPTSTALKMSDRAYLLAESETTPLLRARSHLPFSSREPQTTANRSEPDCVTSFSAGNTNAYDTCLNTTTATTLLPKASNSGFHDAHSVLATGVRRQLSLWNIVSPLLKGRKSEQPEALSGTTRTPEDIHREHRRIFYDTQNHHALPGCENGLPESLSPAYRDLLKLCESSMDALQSKRREIEDALIAYETPSEKEEPGFRRKRKMVEEAKKLRWDAEARWEFQYEKWHVWKVQLILHKDTQRNRKNVAE